MTKDIDQHGQPLSLLTVTSLYPNAAEPHKAVFVENRLRRIIDADNLSTHVVAPVPWFPFTNSIFGSYGIQARTPSMETRHGIEITHPRYLMIPKFGINQQANNYAAALTRTIENLRARDVRFDLIDAHYMYPDGVAAARVAQQIGVPVTVTCRGTDLNLIADLAGPDKQIRAAFDIIDQLIVVSSALGDRAVELGMCRDRITVLRNGVDDRVFQPSDGAKWRSIADTAKTIIVFVGNLVPLKGHSLVIRALSEIDGAHLLIAGQGPEKDKLETLSNELGIKERVHFLGSLPHEELAGLYSAGDVLVLASEREGWPNVLLEAMACGTPVVATNVGGVSEMVNAPEAGRLVNERTPGAIAAKVRELLENPPPREATRRHAQKFGWDDTVSKQIQLYRRLVAEHRLASGKVKS